MSDNKQDNIGSVEDDWAQALADQTASAQPAFTASRVADVFQPLSGNGADIASTDIELILDVPVQLTAQLGKTRITIKNLLQLAPGSVVELDGLAGEPMDVLINGYLIAQGEVVVVNDKFGIRLTDIITPSERIHKISR